MLEARALMMGLADADAMLDAIEDKCGDEVILLLKFKTTDDLRDAIKDGTVKFRFGEED